VTTIATQGTARLVGSAEHGVVRNGVTPVAWNGHAHLYELTPPLRGFSTVVASTLDDAPRIAAGGGVQRGVETFLLAVTDGLQLADADELPGSGWGNTAEAAFAEAGYRIVG
jgi:hypothetical protein